MTYSLDKPYPKPLKQAPKDAKFYEYNTGRKKYLTAKNLQFKKDTH